MTSHEVKGYIQELNNIDYEIKTILKETNRLNSRLRILRSNKESSEHKIIKYIEEKNIPGLKYQGRQIELKSKQKAIKMDKKEKKNKLERVLYKYGINNTEDVDEVFNSLKADKEYVNILNFKKLKV